MLAICELLLQREMPTETTGFHKLPGLDRQRLNSRSNLRTIRCQFLVSFISSHRWTVTSQAQLSWHMPKTSNYMPSMSPDLILQHKITGRMVVLYTKFTPNSLILSRWDNYVFDSLPPLISFMPI